MASYDAGTLTNKSKRSAKIFKDWKTNRDVN